MSTSRDSCCLPSVKIPKKDTKNHCGSRCPKYVELGHFTLLIRELKQTKREMTNLCVV